MIHADNRQENTSRVLAAISRCRRPAPRLVSRGGSRGLGVTSGGQSAVPENRVVFNIKGNDYRLLVKINYPYRVVYIRFVGTHAEYDEIDVETV